MIKPGCQHLDIDTDLLGRHGVAGLGGKGACDQQQCGTEAERSVFLGCLGRLVLSWFRMASLSCLYAFDMVRQSPQEKPRIKRAAHDIGGNPDKLRCPWMMLIRRVTRQSVKLMTGLRGG
jgi:hypothetical protein